MRIAVIIPARNEADRLGGTIDCIRSRGTPARIIVVDCASTDRTSEVAAAAGVDVVGDPFPATRAGAKRAGADHARRACPAAEALLFHHADSRPPPGWDEAIATALRDESVVGGAFDFAWDLAETPWHARPILAMIAVANRARFRVTKRYYGDQGIFVRPRALDAVGGIPDVDLLEDVILCRRLRRHGRLRLARGRMVTSPRRFLRHGAIRQTLFDILLLTAELLRVRPRRLHARYNRDNAQA